MISESVEPSESDEMYNKGKLLMLLFRVFVMCITSIDEEMCWWKVYFIGKKVIKDINDAHSILLALVALGN